MVHGAYDRAPELYFTAWSRRRRARRRTAPHFTFHKDVTRALNSVPREPISRRQFLLTITPDIDKAAVYRESIAALPQLTTTEMAE